MDGYLLNKKAFSLIEVALSLGVIAMILLVVLLLGGQVLNKIKDVKANDDVNAVAQACQLYYRSLGHWPNQVGDLQPTFLSSGINSSNYVLNHQTNILTVTASQTSTTVVRPRGLVGKILY